MNSRKMYGVLVVSKETFYRGRYFFFFFCYAIIEVNDTNVITDGTVFKRNYFNDRYISKKY